MKKCLVILLILFQCFWGIEVSGFSCVDYELPSFGTIIKVAYLSLKESIKNLINIYYILLTLPKRSSSDRSSLPKKKESKFSFIFSLDTLQEKLKGFSFLSFSLFRVIFFDDFVVYYYLKFFDFSEIFLKGAYYYFILPRSSI